MYGGNEPSATQEMVNSAFSLLVPPYSKRMGQNAENYVGIRLIINQID